MTTPDLLTEREAATILRLKPRTVRRACARGELQHVRVGRALRIPREALSAAALKASPENK